jgi:Domain of unknown function (DUF1772)
MPIFGTATESIIFPTATPRVVIVTTVGISLAALFAGSNYALSSIALPAILLPAPKPGTYRPSASIVSAQTPGEQTQKAGTTPAHLARQWQKLHQLGQFSLPLTAIGSSTAYLVACFSIPETLKTQRSLYIAAAILSVSVAPFTRLVMKSTDDELHLRADAATEDDEATEEEGNMGEGYQTQGLMKCWGGLILWRASLPAAGVVAAVTAMVW